MNDQSRKAMFAKKGLTMKEFLKSGNYLEDEVRNRSDKKGGHFFDKDSMKFFSSRVSDLMWQKGGSNDSSYKTKDIYFITSEADRGHIKHGGSVRGFTIRKSSADGDINTVSKFQEYSTLGEARKELKDTIGNGTN
jgi:hypothetical protein